MKILYYDCFSGISGDMNLGAMIDLGVDKAYLIEELSKLNLKEYSIKVGRANRKGIEGTKVDVILTPLQAKEEGAVGEEHTHSHNGHTHEHTHHHAHQEHTHGQDHDHAHGTQEHVHEQAHGVHRNLKDIEKIIQESDLSENVKRISLNMFMKVAQAESKVHGKSLYEVHFHEVGAVDSIVDIVGAAICLEYLKVDKVMSSPIEVGGGFVKCAHGIIPVPAPATVEILKGIPIKSGAVPFETTTPTGAAILAANVEEFTAKKEFIIHKIGYGVGNRDTEIPNVLRVFLGEIEEVVQNNSSKEKVDSKDPIVEAQHIMECNLDDMNAERYEYVMEKLFRIGAADVYLTPIIMKKGRPATKISVLYKKHIEEQIKEILFKETTTLGVRTYKVEKTMLPRQVENLQTPYGIVRVKHALYEGKVIKSKPEYEDCKRMVQESNLSMQELYAIIEKQLS